MANKYYWATVNTEHSNLTANRFFASKIEAMIKLREYAQNIIEAAQSATPEEIVTFVQKSRNHYYLTPIKFDNGYGTEMLMFQLGSLLVTCELSVNDIMFFWTLHYKLRFIKG